MLLDPDDSPDWRPVYRLLTSLIVPRPIAWVSTMSASGALNLAPFSFFNAVCAKPPTVVFCPMLSGRTGATKDTLNNLREVPEFVLQVVSEEMAEKMNLCSGEFAAEVDEFSVAGLAPAASRKVSVPRVAEARAVMECRLQEIITVGSGPGSGSLVLGEVVLFEVEDSLLVRGEVAVEELAPIGRLAGAEYCRLTDRFSMQRPEPESLGVRPRLAPEER